MINIFLSFYNLEILQRASGGVNEEIELWELGIQGFSCNTEKIRPQTWAQSFPVIPFFLTIWQVDFLHGWQASKRKYFYTQGDSRMAFGGPASGDMEHHFHCILLLSHQPTQVQGQGHGPTSPLPGVCSFVVKPPHGDIPYGPLASSSLGLKPEPLPRPPGPPFPSATRAQLCPPSSAFTPLQPPAS